MFSKDLAAITRVREKGFINTEVDFFFSQVIITWIASMIVSVAEVHAIV